MVPTTACPLDCYDACRVVLDEKGRIKGDKTHPVTRGYLCPHLNHFEDQPRLTDPTYKGEVITMEEAYNLLIAQLQTTHPAKTLYYRGSGNVGVMQRVTEHFFGQFGAMGTRGSLCDGAGEAGIIAGRGVNYPLSPEMIDKSEVVIVWGRNPSVTHSHLLPILQTKTVIVIDPIAIPLAQKAQLHIQLKPHGDLALALLLSRFALIEGMEDTQFLDNYGSDYEEFYELTQTVRIKATLNTIGVSLGQIGDILALIRNKRTVILVGAGVQKYRNGADVVRAIDAFGAILGLLGKEGCGVSYLGNSLEGITLPFAACKHKMPKPTLDFSRFETVFIQGGNPLSQMPNTSKVEREFSQVPFKVYFGLYDNETSQASDLVIPAQTFLEKNDFRASYSDFTFQTMPQLRFSPIGISEYALAKILCDAFGLPLKEEVVYLDHFRAQIAVQEGIEYKKESPPIPYSDGFSTPCGNFEFMDEVELNVGQEEGFYLITPKSSHALNSQFSREAHAFFHPTCGFEAGKWVKISNKVGEVTLMVQYDAKIRPDCVLIYSGTPKINHLTPSQLSYEGEGAIYQELNVKVTPL